MADVPVAYYNTDHSQSVAVNHKWWDAKSAEMHSHQFGVIKKIRENQAYRTTNYLRFARLYSNMELKSLAGGLFAQVGNNDAQNFLANRVTFNVIKSCVDTIAAKIAKNKPRPVFLTEKGLWNMQQRAKLLSEFILATFESMGTGWNIDRTMYGMGQQCFVDAAIFGTGAVKLFIDGEKIKGERVFIDEILVDETEGRYRQPRQLHQVKLINRDTLYDMFPAKYHNRIKAVPSGIAQDNHSLADMVEVAESWHLPSSPGAKDGRKAIGIENCTLAERDYEADYFPFLFQRWNLKTLGFYGGALTEELIGIQLEINKLLRNIQLAQHLAAVPQVWLDVKSKVVTKHINNEIGGIKFYAGAPPIFMTPGAMNGEIYNHLQDLYRKAYELTGISQLSAGSMKPAGLDSAVALREYQDIETERFALVGQMYEDFYIDATYMIVDMFRDLKKRGINATVQMKNNNFSRTLKWSDVEIPDDKMAVKAYPTNLLPSTPAGKLAKVQELTQSGFYTQEEAYDLLDYPDTQKVRAIKLAPRDAVHKSIDTMVETGEYVSPEPYMNLEYARQYAQNMYLCLKADGAPESICDLMRRYMEDVKGMLEPDADNTQITADGNGSMPPPVDPAAAGLPPIDPMAAPIDPMTGQPIPMDALPPQGLPPEAAPIDPALAAQGVPV